MVALLESWDELDDDFDDNEEVVEADTAPTEEPEDDDKVCMC